MSDQQAPYIGITGIVSTGNIRALRRLAWAAPPPFGYRWMAGVLVSGTTRLLQERAQALVQV